jgi:hypothetical protein
MTYRARLIFRLARFAVLGAVSLGLLTGLAHTDSHSGSETRLLGNASLAAACHEHDGLPDPRCTPGAVRGGVSLATICGYGYSPSVRPPESYTEPLKFKQMREYGLTGHASQYEEDHLVPLSIGGAPTDSANLWPEPRTGPYNAEEKDQLETWVARMACSHQIPLARLQQEMAEDWTALFRAAGGERVLRNYPPGG